MKQVLYLLIIFSFTSCQSTQEEKMNNYDSAIDNKENSNLQKLKYAPPSLDSLLELNNAKIIQTKELDMGDMSIHTIIKEQLSEKQISELANAIRYQYNREGRNTYIFLLLPENSINSRAWATAHFEPTLNIKILGLSKEQEKSIKSTSTLENEIGKWYCADCAIPVTIILYKKNGAKQGKFVYKDGSSGEHKVVELKGGKFKFENSYAESTYKINSQGNLEVYSSGNLFTTARKENN